MVQPILSTFGSRNRTRATPSKSESDDSYFNRRKEVFTANRITPSSEDKDEKTDKKIVPSYNLKQFTEKSQLTLLTQSEKQRNKIITLHNVTN